MSSQAIATSARGLPDFPSPSIDLHDFQEPTWSDHSNPRNNDSKDEAEQIDSDQEGQAWVEMDAQQRNQAVGNLLAALAPLSPTLNAKTPNVKMEQEEPHTNGGEDEMEVTDDKPAQFASNDPYSTLPQADTNHNMSLPPLPPFPADDFMTHEAPAPFSSAIASDIPEASQATLIGDAPMIMDYPVSQPPLASQDVQNERREIEAFAKIEFEDGNYYITTYACELGRDAFAYKAALARAEEAAQAERDRAQSSSGRRSGLSEGIPRPGDSQVQGSVVSEAGGFGGVDDAPVLQDGERVGGNPLGSNSSERSGGSIVKPQEVLINPPLIPFDYHKMAERQAQFEPGDDPEQDTELPAPVTADHIPDADNCPLIPIHAMRTAEKSEVENHKSISRRHVKIEWDFKEDYFQMKVLGRNGAFLDDEYLNRGSVRRLSDGSKIQISDVWMTFRLPSQNAEPLSEESEREDLELSPPPQESLSPLSNDEEQSLSPSRSGKTRTKVTLTFAQKPSPTVPDGPDGQPMPPKKRGPGRPPKDGIMSTRERKEREKAQKLAEAKAANGGKTPPPGLLRGKFPKPPVIKEEEPVLVETKPEKRKYKKRKREDGEVLQSIEGNEVDVSSEPENAPPQKKARQSKSPSPEYPPVGSLTEEQLARPSEPYARLIYDILIDIHPDALPLKQIYRALKLKFPFFVHRVDSEGWQSSVRHNLNQEYEKLFDKAKKEGKGFFWKAIPGALQPQAERRRAAQQAAAAKPKPPPAPRQNPQQGPPPPLNWQNSTPYPQQNGMPPRGPPPPFFVQGPNGPMPPPPNGVPWPPPGATASPGPNGRPPQVPPGQKGQPFYPPPQAGQLPFPSQQAPGAGQQTPGKPGVPQPPSAGPGPPPPPPVTSSASRNMPCTTDGLLAIRRFETAMYEQVGNSSKIEEWQQVFASVKRRLLHGAPHSLLPDGENREELTIMAHVRNFIERFKNPNFVGFSNTGSPAPSNAAITANGLSTASASTATTIPQPVSQPTPLGAPSAPADVPPKVEGLEPGNETAKAAEQPDQPSTLADDKMDVDIEPAVQNIASA